MGFERQDGSPQSVEFPFFLGGRFAFRSSGATPGSAALDRVTLAPRPLSGRRTGQSAALILEPTHLCNGFEGRHAAERERRRGRATRPCLVFNKRRRTRRDRKSASAPRQAIFNGVAGDAYEEAESRTT